MLLSRPRRRLAGLHDRRDCQERFWFGPGGRLSARPPWIPPTRQPKRSARSVLIVSTMNALDINEFPDSQLLWARTSAPGSDPPADAAETASRPSGFEDTASCGVCRQKCCSPGAVLLWSFNFTAVRFGVTHAARSRRMCLDPIGPTRLENPTIGNNGRYRGLTVSPGYLLKTVDDLSRLCATTPRRIRSETGLSRHL